MNALTWVRKNCKFAIDLSQAPANWESNDSAMRRTRDFQKAPAMAPADPNDNEVTKFHQSTDSMQIIQNETKAWSDDVEVPTGGGFNSPETYLTKQYYITGKVVIKGSIYYPDSFIASTGPIETVINRDFKEIYPKELEEMLSSYFYDESTYKLISIQRNGDYYDVVVEGNIDGTSSLDD